MKINKSLLIWIISLIAISFGILTIKSGGFALFGGEEGKVFARNYIPIVLWFNFIAGFFYVLAGVGLIFNKIWASRLAVVIAIMTIIVFAILGLYIINGTQYEMRTVWAMCVRTSVWVIISAIGIKKLNN